MRQVFHIPDFLHEPISLAVGAGGVVWAFCRLSFLFSFFFSGRLKYSLKGPLNQKKKKN